VIFDEHPWLELALGPVVDIFGWRFDYRWIALSLVLAVACLITVYLLFRPRRLSLRSFLQTTLPVNVYLNPSSRIDYVCLFVYPALLTLLSYAGVELVSEWQVSAAVAQSLQGFGGIGFSAPEHVVVTAVVFVVGAIIGDFSQYAVHVLYHKVPALWEFHKAHHSAKVLTPFTGTRIYLWEASAIAFQLYFLGFLTSHYHLPVRFGIFERLVVSPAFHMAHHVNHPDFYNKNFGHIFSFWDRLFATDVAPITDMNGLTLGISPDDEYRYDGVVKLHLAPFLGLHRLVKEKLWKRC
jgi:sterol desaturase/sphingolipid hydroxylase (fatty acid hydroxylase superfamily)